jgi:hypothetical protein
MENHCQSEDAEEYKININIINNDFYAINDIINILKVNNFPKDIIDRIDDKYLTREDIDILLNPKKTFITIKRRQRNKKSQREKKNFSRKGRKEKDSNIQANHSKDSNDNIIRKIKVYIFKNLIAFSNNYISNEKRLVNLDYKCISNLKKEFNLKMLKYSLAELLSYKTSLKNGSHKENHNKNIILKILEKEKNNEKIKRLLNMKFNDWINIFLFKQKIEDNIIFNGLKSILEDIIIKFHGDNDYLTRFVFYLYNYQRWFENKKGRKKKQAIKD